MPAKPRPTAAFLVIGDEILTGKIRDENSFTLAKLLFARGVALERIETVPDRTPVIAEAVGRLARTHDHVFTSGGVGPTHDDVTYDGVAAAFGKPLAHHAPTLEKMEAFYAARGEGLTLNEARRKMALFPEGAEVLTPSELWVPVVRTENVWVLPGVPRLFEMLLGAIKERFVGEPLHRAFVYTQRPEGDVADVLREAQDAHPHIAIGSYPHYGEPDHKVMITFDGLPGDEVEALADRVAAAVEGFRDREPSP